MQSARGVPFTYCIGSTNSQGCVVTLASSGVPSASTGSGFTLHASQLVNQREGVVFYSLGGADLRPFGTGWLCVAGALRRTQMLPTGGSPGLPLNCTGSLTLDFNAWIASGVDASLVAGRSVSAQVWARDPALPTARFDITNALRFVIGL